MEIKDIREPITISWADILLTYKAGEERDYNPSMHNGIRGAISRTIKYRNPERKFTTSFRDNEHGEPRLYVRRVE